MKPNKLNMTRPEFLTTLMLDSPSADPGGITIKDLQKLLHVSYDVIYCTYTILLKANLSKKELALVDSDDDGTVVIRLKEKARVKEIRDYITGEVKIRLGDKKYKVEVETKGDHLFITVILTNPEILKQSITGYGSSSEDED